MRLLLPFLLFLSSTLFAQNAKPEISSLSASVDWNTNTLTVFYDVEDVENDPIRVQVFLSDDPTENYNLTGLVTTSGDVGFPVTAGSGKQITVDVSNLAGMMGNNFTLRLVVDDQMPVDIQSLVDQVDSNRIRSDLEFVEGIRHRSSGKPHLLAVRDSMSSLFSALGLCAAEHVFPYLPNYDGVNPHGFAAGTSSAQEVIIDAHYDTVVNAPGADDNGSGVVGVMEAARILSEYPSEKGIRFMGFDLEEAGLIGSIRYATKAVNESDSIAGVINFEMIGYYSEQPNSQELPVGFNILFPDAYDAVSSNDFKGDFITNVGNEASGPLVDLYETSAAQYVPDLKVISVKVPGNGEIAPDLRRSDHAPFWEGNYQALMITDGANFRNQCYHTPGDTLDGKLDFTFMSNVVKAGVATAAQLAGLLHGDSKKIEFSGTSSITEPVPCGARVWSSSPDPGGVWIAADVCNRMDVQLKLIDLQGMELQTLNLKLSSGQKQFVPLQYSRMGVYLIQLTDGRNQSTWKLFLD